MENENKKLGSEPAFPEVELNSFSWQPQGQKHGISKRFYAACAAMQGILANQSGQYGVMGNSLNESYKRNLISQSYQFADELLKQENE